MNQEKITENVLWEVILSSCDQFWSEVMENPRILKYRETHTHVLIGRHLLNNIAQSGCLDNALEVVFDDPSPLKSGGYISWMQMGKKLRPDISLIPNWKIYKMGVLIEIKCIRDTDRLVIDDMGKVHRKRRNVCNQIRNVGKDIDRLKELCQIGCEDKGFHGVMLIYYIGDKERNEKEHDQIKWMESVDIDEHKVSRAVMTNSRKYSPASLDGIFDELPVESIWHEK